MTKFDAPKFDENWVAREEAKRAMMAEKGLYSPEEEHSSCGVGLVVNIDGSKTRSVVENGIKALKAIWHRGAVDADGKTGDGAGIHVQIPVPVDCLGEKANATRPEIEQILISNSKGVDEETFERELYVIRRRIEKAAIAAQVPTLYIASMSCRSIIYKDQHLPAVVARAAVPHVGA